MATQTIPYTIKRRWFSSLPPITVEIGAEYENASDGAKLGAAVRVIVGKARDKDKRAVLTGAVLTDADLTCAVLTGAVLTGAVLTDADLTRADLTCAVLTGADLTCAVLTGAVLTDADLTCAVLTGAVLTDADLTGADLTDADLTGADLTRAKNDLWTILLANKNEVDGLLTALREGRVDGSTYRGDCACLVGTIANVRGVSVDTLPQNSSRPAERWFLAIRKGDTPETSAIAKITAEWIEEFQRLMAA